MHYLQLLLLTLSLVFTWAHVFDPDLSLPYFEYAPHLNQGETMTIQLSPLARSTTNSTITCPLEVSWDLKRPLEVSSFCSLISAQWEEFIGGGTLNFHQIMKMTSKQLMMLIYRHKYANSGVIKVKYLARGEQVDLYFDLPPITPGEYRCLKLHEASLREKFARSKERYTKYMDYLSHIGAAAQDAQALEEPFKSDNVAALERKNSAIKARLNGSCVRLAQCHYELAIKLHTLRSREGQEDWNEKLGEYKAILSKIPGEILPKGKFVEIRDFVRASELSVDIRQ